MALLNNIATAIKNMFEAKMPAVMQNDTAYSSDVSYYSAGWPSYNPDDLITRKGYGIYTEMMRDEQVKVCARFRRNAVTGRSWFFECEYEQLSETEQERRIKISEEIINQMEGSFKSRLDRLMSSLVYGHSVTEKKLKHITYDGKLYYGIEKLAGKSPDTFEFNEDEYGNLVEFVQNVSGDKKELDPKKFIFHIHNSDTDEYYGRSELREAYRAWFGKDIAIRLQNIHMERTAVGFYTLTPEPTSNLILTEGSEDYNRITSILNNLRSSAGILLPKGIKGEIHQFTATDIFDKIINSNNRAIAKALLMPDMLGLSGDNKNGNRALGDTQLEAFLWMLDTEADDLEETINEQLFKQLGQLNFGDHYYPRFRFNPLSKTQIIKIAEAWGKLVTAGAVTATDTDEDYLREMLDFPEKGETESEPANNPAMPSPGSGSLDIPSNSNQSGDTKKQGETIIGDTLLQIAYNRASKRVDFSAIDTSANVILFSAEQEISDSISTALDSMFEKLRELPLVDPAESKSIKVSSSYASDVRKAYRKMLDTSWKLGETQGRQEIKKSLGKNVNLFSRLDFERLEDIAAKYLSVEAFNMAGDLTAEMLAVFAREIQNGIKYSKSIKEVEDAILESLAQKGLLPQENITDALAEKLGVKEPMHRVRTAIRTATFSAINEARYNFFTDPSMGGYVEALAYSAILDSRTTPICQELDGNVYPLRSDEWEKYRPPNHFNCRSLLVAVTQGDEYSISDSPILDPAIGFK